MGPVRFGLELGLTADLPKLDLFLGRSMLDFMDTMTSQWTAWPLSDSPAMTFGRRIREEHDCHIASHLGAEVRAVATQSRWTAAFDYQMPSGEIGRWVTEIEDSFIGHRSS
jgi:hypothetical protein